MGNLTTTFFKFQPYVHPDFGTREGALVAASDITTHVVMPLLTDDVMSSSLPLHVLMKCLSCGLISKDLEAHCSVDRDHLLQLLLVVLEIHEEIEQFWIDWQAGSGRFVYSFNIRSLEMSTFVSRSKLQLDNIR
jgi:hypothetical protein